MIFSSRTHLDAEENALTLRVAEARARAAERTDGKSFIDLTLSNPTSIDLPYDEREILAALSDPRALRYRPDALGLLETRALVAADWTSSGVPVDASRIALTASTSEAYAILFKMLADPGDEILVPRPSYPLLGFLASFEAVKLVPYPLVYAGGWHVDREALAARITERTRAIVVVTPNNPTGSYLGRGELDAMLDFGLPIVSDEVFARYPLQDGVPEGRIASVLEARRGLVFALSGLSKLVALPQMKLGWIGVAGESALVERAMDRLELVLDAYLSVSTPVQYAAKALLASGAKVREAISARTKRNLAALRSRVGKDHPASVLEVEGGWYAVLRIPETCSDEAGGAEEAEEEWALRFATEEHVYVHPGYFFDMHRGAHIVVSLLPREAEFVEGIERILGAISALHSTLA